jgi:hypothetical protein
MRERIKAAVAFVLAWLSTPSSKAGIVAILTGLAGKWLAPAMVEAVYYSLLLGAGVALVLWPQKPK